MVWQPGQSGNPSGRKKGARTKAIIIKEAFFDAFEESGGVTELVEFIRETKTNRRDFYKMLVALVPKELDVLTTPEEVERMTDAELIAIASEAKSDAA